MTNDKTEAARQDDSQKSLRREMMLKTSKKTRGFTLVELMVTLAVLAIAATIAVPSFTRFIRSNQAQAQTNEIAQLIQYTRSQAASQRRTQSISINGNIWTAASGGSGERSFEPRPGIGFNITGGGGAVTAIDFNAMGVMTEPTTEVQVAVCHTADSNIGYRITINRAGATRVTRLGTCSL